MEEKELFCSNCKNKINSNDVFCPFCGDIIISRTIINDNDKNIEKIKLEKTDTEIKNKNEEKDGMLKSQESLLLFFLFYAVYLISLIYTLIYELITGENAGGGFILVLGGGFVFLPTFFSFKLGISAVKLYNKSDKKNEKKRRIFNILNIISLILMGIYFILCGLIILFILFFPIIMNFIWPL